MGEKQKLDNVNAVYESFVAQYQKLRTERQHAKEQQDLDWEMGSELLMKQMKRVIADLHKALERDQMETL